jgi:hypothetical protein
VEGKPGDERCPRFRSESLAESIYLNVKPLIGWTRTQRGPVLGQHGRLLAAEGFGFVAHLADGAALLYAQVEPHGIEIPTLATGRLMLVGFPCKGEL